jgi:hypothetical protein
LRILSAAGALHDLKARAWPQSPEAPHWRIEVHAFRYEAAKAFAPSMRQRIDVAALYREALRRLPSAVAGQVPLPVPRTCPVTLDEMLADAE